MATLQEIVLKNFKSFRYSRIPLNDNFVCIVGPNGAGKSNIVDGIRFVLGENSLKELRAKKISDLIYQNREKAFIKLKLFDGNESIEILRGLRSDGKTFFKLNGKRITRSSLLDFLRSKGIEIGEHNVIAQGEFEKIVKLNPKERREIVEEIAGIKEYEEKKKEALAELGKVEQKLNDATIVLKEREGILIELEKEKKMALEYNSLKEEQRRLKGSLILAQYKKIEKEFTDFTNKVLEINNKIGEISKEIERQKEEVNKINEKRMEINSKINSIDTKNIYIEVEKLKGSLEKNISLLESKNSEIEENEKQITKINDEIKTITQKLDAFTNTSKSLAQRAAELRKIISQLESEKEKIIKNWEEKKKKLGSLDIELDKLKEQSSLLKQEIAKIAGTEKEIKEKKKRKELLQKELEKIEKEINEIKEKKDFYFEEEKRINEKIKEIDLEILRLSEKVIFSKDRTDQVLNEIRNDKQNKKIVDKIYGKVVDLFKADEKYSAALAAAGGNRLNYVVVEDRETAVEVIKYVREKNLGRITLIPLSVDVNIDERIKVAGDGIIGKAIDLIVFDKKFRKVFEYVFGNTIIVEKDEILKKINCRAASLNGSIIEESGVISGGVPLKLIPSNVEVELEKKKEDRKKLLNKLYELQEIESNLRRSIAEYEVRKKEIEIEIKNIDELYSQSVIEKEADLQEIERKIMDLQGEKERIRIALENSEDEKERNEIEKKIVELKTELSSIETKLKSEESILLQERLNQLQNEKNLIDTKVKKLREEIKDIKKEVEEIKKKITIKEEKIKSESEILEKLYNEMKNLNELFDNYNIEIGKNERKIEKLKEELIRYETLKEEAQKKLIDLKYEADFYKDITPLEMKKEEMEKRLYEVEAALSSMKSVNLRAIELYDEKLKSYNEIKSKVETLMNEKNSILKVIEEINARKKGVFLRTFEEINKNFKNLTKNLFEGECYLSLENEEDPFSGGLNIVVKLNKKERNIELMSGGEKSLLTLMFIFSMHFFKPSPFYILDEAEAALDKENSRKFSEFIKSIAKETNTQFILVTHNDAVIVNCKIALGITKDRNSSKLVALNLEEVKAKK